MRKKVIVAGTLVGSRAQRQGGALGLSYIGEQGFLGFFN